MKKCGTFLGSFILLTTFVACSDYDYHYPDVLTELVDMQTDSQSHIQFIRTDDGSQYVPDKQVSVKDATPDSLYRMHCVFQPGEEGKTQASIYSITTVVSPFPKVASQFKNGVITDPVKVTSIWNSGGYINFHLGVMTKGGKHGFHFAIQEHAKNLTGHYTQHLTLYHSQGDDPEAYTREVFLSCPLSKLDLVEGDSILFTVNTYNGLKEYGFLK